MDWNNVDLNSSYERDQNILSPYSFDTLLLEVQTNLRDISRDSVRKQFETELRSKVREAREIFDANINSIVDKALEERGN